MKLRNKKTGEIGLVHCDATMFSNKIGVFIDNNHIDLCNPYKIYTSLAELNEEWCDYKEPKGTYFINTQGDVQFWDSSSFAYPDDWTKEKEIGNYFETKEEAEKAVEKLKIYNKLKQKGFVFSGWYYSTEGQLVILADNNEFSETEPEDLTKLFGDKVC